MCPLPNEPDGVMRLRTLLNRPLAIGAGIIRNRLALAPMVQLGNVAFRELLAQSGGCGLMFTEMCGAKRILHENRFVSPYFRWRDEELPWLVCQIFGNDPSTMADAARRIEDEGFFGVDINFGCAASSICRQAGGAALLKNPVLAARIVSEVRRAVRIPLFVKFRTGWRDDPQYAVDMARRFEEAGADALTFHPRVAPDRRAHPPKWEYIGHVKTAVNIPVFGNGNVFDAGDCLKMITQTECDAVSVGRMAVARPWLFTQWNTGISVDPPPYYETALRLTQLLSNHFHPKEALRRFVRFSLYFSANFLFGHTLHTKILNARDMSAARQCLDDFFQNPPEVVSRPNMNFFI